MSDLVAKLGGSVGAFPQAEWDALAGGNPFVSHAFLTALEDSGSVGPGTGWQSAPIVIEDAERGIASDGGLLFGLAVVALLCSAVTWWVDRKRCTL